MTVYEHESVVDAPLDRVWAFHVDPGGLPALTPAWLHLRIESVTGPDDEADPDVLEAGSRMVSSVRPFGVGPRQRWTSEITTARREDDRAVLRDRMVEGPFPRWDHTHRFESVGGDGSDDAGSDDAGSGPRTRVTDRVTYRLPGGPVGSVASPVGFVGLEPLFRFRHRRLRKLLDASATRY